MATRHNREIRKHKTVKHNRKLLKPQLFPQNISIHPGDNFYLFINNKWLNKTHIPSFLSSFSVSEEIENQVDAELYTILDKAKQSVDTQKHISTSDYLIGTFVQSVEKSHRSPENLQTVQAMLLKIQCCKTIDDIGCILGKFFRLQIPTVLECSIFTSEKDLKLYRLTFCPGKLTLLDESNYETDTKNKKYIQTVYKSVLKRISHAFNILHVDEFIEFEHEMANTIDSTKNNTEVLVSGSTLLKQYRHIPWKSFSSSIFGSKQFSKFSKHKFLLLSKEYISKLNTWFNKLSINVWKTILSYNLIFYVLSVLPSPYNDWYFELFSHTMHGQTIKAPLYRTGLKLVKKWLSKSLGEEFVKNYVPLDIKSHVESIAKEIKKNAAERVGMTDWFSPSTQKKAKSKVEKLILSIAYPSVFPKDTKITLSKTNLVQNIFDLAEQDYILELEKKMDTKINPTFWDDDIFAVNAYYYNEGNHLILPSGILRYPFYDYKASDGWNFGGIGATIGHEICHAFDNDGKDYDEDGVFHTWWTKDEIELYKQKSDALIKLFSNSTYFGEHIDGINTLSENIADLGGLAIALSALKQHLTDKGVSSHVYKKELCNFFISFAVSWRVKDRKQNALQSIFTDVHAPAILRVNNIVSQFNDWYTCFDVQPTNVLYKNPQDRIRIF